MEVNLVGHTLPDAAGGVALGKRQAVDTKEDIVCVYEVFHEGDAQFVHAAIMQVAVGVSYDGSGAVTGIQ